LEEPLNVLWETYGLLGNGGTLNNSTEMSKKRGGPKIISEMTGSWRKGKLRSIIRQQKVNLVGTVGAKTKNQKGIGSSGRGQAVFRGIRVWCRAKKYVMKGIADTGTPSKPGFPLFRSHPEVAQEW